MHPKHIIVELDEKWFGVFIDRLIFILVPVSQLSGGYEYFKSMFKLQYSAGTSTTSQNTAKWKRQSHNTVPITLYGTTT